MRDAWDIQAESIEATNRRIDKLANPRLTRGKVVSVNPLRITLDDDPTTVLPDTPANDAGPLAVGDRVRCIHQGSQVVIIGRAGGQGDTGWIDCTYRSGFTPGTAEQLQARLKGDEVRIRGGAAGSLPMSTYTPVADLPAGIPAPLWLHRDGVMGTGGRAGGVEITPSGQINLVHYLSSGPTWLAATTTYSID